MKPAWDKLIEEFKDSKTALVADVDCTVDGGKSLCEKIGVQGFPSIKHGDPNNLEDYKGARDFDTLKKFADENLGPNCGPAHLDLCNAEKKAVVESFMKLSESELEAAIKQKTDALEKVESDFKSFMEVLQKQYTDGNEKKDKDVEAIQNSGLRFMKSEAQKRGLNIGPPRNKWIGLALGGVGIFVICCIIGGFVMWLCLGQTHEQAVQNDKAEKVEETEKEQKVEDKKND